MAYVLQTLLQLGLQVPVIPDSAFFVYVDCSRYTQTSTQFVMDILHATW